MSLHLLSMNTQDLKTNFNNQLKEIEEKIAQIQSELNKAKEYKLKLEGGLETLELLEKSSTVDEIPMQPGEINNTNGHLDSAYGEFPELDEMESNLKEETEEE